MNNTTEITYPCTNCGQLPFQVKHTFQNSNEVHWSIKCNCKQTEVYRSFLLAEMEWEGGLYNQLPKPKI